MSVMLEAVPFPPTGDTLWAHRGSDGRIFVAVKPICEGIGLDWHSQRQRIHRTPALAEGEVMITAPSSGGMQRTLCLPLDLLPGWLFGVDVSRVKPELRDRLIAYQRECHRVLFEHFKRDMGTALMSDSDLVETPLDSARDAELPEGFGMPEATVNLWLRIIGEARLLKGRETAARIWQGSPLARYAPLVEADEAASPEWIDVFLSECTERVIGGRVRSDALWQAYLTWCGQRVVDPHSRKRFGAAVGARLQAVKCSVVYYQGVRLRV